jgi:hypothetical protein
LAELDHSGFRRRAGCARPPAPVRSCRRAV